MFDKLASIEQVLYPAPSGQPGGEVRRPFVDLVPVPYVGMLPRNRTCPRALKRARHNFHRVNKPSEHGVRHGGQPAIIWSTVGLAALSAFAR